MTRSYPADPLSFGFKVLLLVSSLKEFSLLNCSLSPLGGSAFWFSESQIPGFNPRVTIPASHHSKLRDLAEQSPGRLLHSVGVLVALDHVVFL